MKEALDETSIDLTKGNVAKPMTDKTITDGNDLYLLYYVNMDDGKCEDTSQYIVDYKMLVDAIRCYHINTPFGLARLERGKPVTKFSTHLCVDSLGYPVGGLMHEIIVALGKTNDKGRLIGDLKDAIDYVRNNIMKNGFKKILIKVGSKSNHRDDIRWILGKES